MEVTSLEELKQIAQGEVIPLPGFVVDKQFCARVKRVSLLGLVQKGVIPNSLLSAANELFYGKNSNNKNVDMKEISNVMIIMAESTLVEPSVDQLKEIDLSLTDEQIVALFNYTQKGLKAIEKFPQDTKNNVSANDGQTLQDEAKSDNKSE